MIHNVLFIVEGKTEGLANAFGKGLQNILRAECNFMKQRGIRHHTLSKNGTSDLLSNVAFDVRQHLNPSRAQLARLARKGSALGDYVFILRDLDCEDEAAMRELILGQIALEFHDRVGIHFAVQEIETWMLADPQGFYSVYRHAPSALLADIQRLVPSGQSPEVAIGCHPQPSEHLQAIVRRYERVYRKTIEGPQALGKVNPDVVAERCPHFKTFSNSLREQIGMPLRP
jgi:hypothetical protein